MCKLINLAMISCKKASVLMDKQSVIKLSVAEKVMLYVHSGLYEGCKSYQEQSSLLDDF